MNKLINYTIFKNFPDEFASMDNKTKRHSNLSQYQKLQR